jgi:two-component system chemotaxis sensor kinase CheA
MAMDDFERELKIGFLEEATAGLADTEQCFLSLENNPGDTENLNKIFRLAHNLKGSSKAVGFTEMGDFTHEFETFILMIKNGELKASSEIVGLLLKCNDHLTKMVEALKENIDAKFDSSALFHEMKAASKSTGKGGHQDHQSAAPSVPAIVYEVEPNRELLAELEAQGFLAPAHVEPHKESHSQFNVEASKDLHPSPIHTTGGATGAPPQGAAQAQPGKHSGVEETIRISLSKLVLRPFNFCRFWSCSFVI